jgi:2-C-methyl-D-erythritol 4-phosphate cytidylyltransferase/2-C-methyl-D-erythritol 2,4-cyclodiphosphate synthase
MRVGIGYDIHRFNGRGHRPLKLGGVTVPAARGLAGHSDADVLLHALTDALLGAVGAPDIGEQFPPNDPRWRNADSRLFIEAACKAVRRAGMTVGNVDATVIADSPKLTGHKPKICRSIGRLLNLPAGRVSVKAKTTEGFPPGKGGIAAHVVVLLQKRGRAR